MFLVAPCVAATFEVKKDGDGVTVTADGKLFTRYLMKSGPKPILWPLVGPTGKEMTRGYPMRDATPDERRDHEHHRSFWFTHGSVNGADFWSEGAKHGDINHREFVKIEGGNNATIVSRNDWIAQGGKKVCEDERSFVFDANADTRWIDVELTVRASDGPVTFGDTKEGAFGVRVAGAMSVDAKKGGKIVNSEGHKDGNAWAKRASWVDYFGPVDGEVLGIAIMNHPSSFRYPTHWHVRTYGLFTANPFGWHDFEGGTADGTYTLPAGESMKLRYRILLHRGDEKEGKVAESFQQYATLYRDAK
jgi:hypothetical protein